MSTFSSLERDTVLAQIQEEVFDLLIIGGGITGAGIALDAALRGMRVCLIEQYDFAGGTSSRSTKLIHGGLRYLKQLEFALVREVGRERAVVHDLAPHLVRPVHMVLPIYKKGSLGRASTALALWVYDTLAKVRKEDRFYMKGKIGMQEIEPLLKKDGLLGGAIYKEYRTDDARLTLSVLKTAVQKGAHGINYVQAVSFLEENEKIKGVQARDLISNQLLHIKAQVVVNATGPWVDTLRAEQETIKGKKLHLTKGVHIVVPANKCPVRHAMYFDVAADGRMIFVIPRDNKVYIGTTDTNYTGDMRDVQADAADVTYLLEAVRNILPEVNLHIHDVESSWAGLRPLIHEEGKKPGELSRKDEVFVSEKGLLSIAGGKLTGYRKMAEKIVDHAASILTHTNGATFPGSSTEHMPLSGTLQNMTEEQYIIKRSGEVKQIGWGDAEVRILFYRYGTDADAIIDIAYDNARTYPDPQELFLYAELRYSIEYEMTCHISDFLIRRTGMLYFDLPQTLTCYTQCGDMLQDMLHLSDGDKKQQMLFFEQDLHTAVTFP
ncbi:MAG: glycerol-3-phosphate dehydrogenase/oxidase [Chitinophagales bacterium]